jgi:hypothetical protein
MKASSNGWTLRKLATVVAYTIAATSASTCAHAAGLSIAWEDCRLGSGLANQAYGCQSELVELQLYPAFVLEADVDSVYAFELVIDVDVAAAELPAWWRMESGGCRANGWSADITAASSCGDPWQGQGVAAFQGWLPGEPGGVARHGRLLIAVAASPGTWATLAPDVAWTAARVLLRTNKTLTCGGCSTPACLVFNSILLRRLPGTSVETVTLSVPESAGAERISWQGGSGADCQSVPARRTTWGAVKSLYR